jgi:hypothetical protein
MSCGRLVQLGSDDYRPNAGDVSPFGRSVAQSLREPGQSAGDGGREDHGFREFGSLFDHGCDGREGDGSDEAPGALDKRDLDAVPGGDETAGDLRRPERARSGANCEEDQDPVAYGLL